jgi:hypothetical protein
MQEDSGVLFWLSGDFPRPQDNPSSIKKVRRESREGDGRPSLRPAHYHFRRRGGKYIGEALFRLK